MCTVSFIEVIIKNQLFHNDRNSEIPSIRWICFFFAISWKRCQVSFEMYGILWIEVIEAQSLWETRGKFLLYPFVLTGILRRFCPILYLQDGCVPNLMVSWFATLKINNRSILETVYLFEDLIPSSSNSMKITFPFVVCGSILSLLLDQTDATVFISQIYMVVAKRSID